MNEGRMKTGSGHGFSKWWVVYLMMLPGILYFVIFRYGPIGGLAIAFQDFRVLKGMTGSPWVGFKHFQAMFSSPVFGRVMLNTLTISVLKLVTGFAPPILLALMLNEMRFKRLKKFIQTVSYLPHFISWIIVAGLLFALLSPGEGIVNALIKKAGGESIQFMTDPGWFLAVLVISEIWKGLGWGAIVYLAALSGIDPGLYEAARLDGASRLMQIRHISIPCISGVIVLMFILRLGYILDAGFEQIYILYNPQVYPVADILDTWVYRNGIEQFRFSISAATGMFKSTIGLILVLAGNALSRKFAGSGIW